MNRSSPKSGIDFLLDGLSLIRRPGLRQYVIVPTIINILVLVLLVMWGTSQFGRLTKYLAASLPDWLAFLSGLFAFLAAILAVIVLLYFFTIIANLVASPFNALLSVRVEEHLTGKTPGVEEGLLYMVVRSTGRELQKLGYLLPRMLGLVVLTSIPAAVAGGTSFFIHQLQRGARTA